MFLIFFFKDSLWFIMYKCFDWMCMQYPRIPEEGTRTPGTRAVSSR